MLRETLKRLVTPLAVLVGTLALPSLAQLDVRAAKVASAPVPASARGPEIDRAKGYFVGEIRDGVYWATEGSHEFMFMTTGRGVVVVDAPPIFGDKAMKAIREVTQEPITHVIYSHWHVDHIGGAKQFPATAQYVTSTRAAELLAEADRPGRQYPFGIFVGGASVPKPTRTFKEKLELKVGNKRIQLRAFASPAHTDGDVMIYLPDQKVLMAVDAVWPGWIPFEDLGHAEDVAGYRKFIQELRTYDFKELVAGHMGRLGTKADVDTTLEYLTDVEQNVVAALKQVKFEDIVQRTGYDNPFLMVEAYFDAVAHNAADATEQKWNGKLAGVDVWTYRHCRTMLKFLRLH